MQPVKKKKNLGNSARGRELRREYELEKKERKKNDYMHSKKKDVQERQKKRMMK